MSLFRIFRYFLGEALVSLWRSWKSQLAGDHDHRHEHLHRWHLSTSERQPESGGGELAPGSQSHCLPAIIGCSWRCGARPSPELAPAWVSSVHEVSGSEASARFRETFPSVQDLLKSWEDEPLPASLEVDFDLSQTNDQAFESWLETLRSDPAVIMVDEDRDWLRQLDALIGILRGVGAVVGLALLGAAVITIGSVIRLTAYLYRDEIAVMRLVGATELYIRGPFFFEGLIQGFLGGLVAVLSLFAAFLGLNPKGTTVLLGTVLVDRFLPWQAILALLGIATLAGCFGAVLSLRREDLASD